MEKDARIASKSPCQSVHDPPSNRYAATYLSMMTSLDEAILAASSVKKLSPVEVACGMSSMASAFSFKYAQMTSSHVLHATVSYSSFDVPARTWSNMLLYLSVGSCIACVNRTISRYKDVKTTYLL